LITKKNRLANRATRSSRAGQEGAQRVLVRDEECSGTRQNQGDLDPSYRGKGKAGDDEQEVGKKRDGYHASVDCRLQDKLYSNRSAPVRSGEMTTKLDTTEVGGCSDALRAKVLSRKRKGAA